VIALRLLRRLKEPPRNDDERRKLSLIKAKHKWSSLRGTKQSHYRITKINSDAIKSPPSCWHIFLKKEGDGYRFKIASSAEEASSQ